MQRNSDVTDSERAQIRTPASFAWSGVATALLVLSACSAGSEAEVERPEPDTVPDTVPTAESIVVDELDFISLDDRERFIEACDCFTELGAAWRHTPLEIGGNSIRERWCNGPGSDGSCTARRFLEQPGIDLAEVQTFHYPQDWPEVFGVAINRVHNPDAGWRTSLSLVDDGGAGLRGVGLNLEFTDQGEPANRISAGSDFRYTIEEWSTSISVPEPVQLLDEIRSSPEALRRHVLDNHEALEDDIVTALGNGEVTKCVYEDDESSAPDGDSALPPVCVEMIPLTAAEVNAHIADVQAQTARVRMAFETDDLFDALIETAPPDCF